MNWPTISALQCSIFGRAGNEKVGRGRDCQCPADDHRAGFALGDRQSRSPRGSARRIRVDDLLKGKQIVVKHLRESNALYVSGGRPKKGRINLRNGHSAEPNPAARIPIRSVLRCVGQCRHRYAVRSSRRPKKNDAGALWRSVDYTGR